MSEPAFQTIKVADALSFTPSVPSDRIYFGNAKRKLSLEIQPDITAYESAKLSQFFVIANTWAKTGCCDVIPLIDELGLSRHFKETP
jgi:hypothetical protein